MTVPDALAAIPEIVNKAIPLTPYKEIQCPTKRAAAVQNAEWRREQLATRIQNLVIMTASEGMSISIDLDKLIKESESKY